MSIMCCEYELCTSRINICFVEHLHYLPRNKGVHLRIKLINTKTHAIFQRLVYVSGKVKELVCSR